MLKNRELPFVENPPRILLAVMSASLTKCIRITDGAITAVTTLVYVNSARILHMHVPATYFNDFYVSLIAYGPLFHIVTI